MSTIQALSASRQLRFHQLLVAARTTVLSDALSDALTTIDPNALRSQLATYVPEDVQQILAAAGIRDEYVFPTTIVLEKNQHCWVITGSYLACRKSRSTPAMAAGVDSKAWNSVAY